MSHELAPALEMYAKTIFALESESGSAHTGEIAKALAVTPGSVTNTLALMEEKGLVKRELYRGVKLTKKGRRLALSVVRRHRLAERLLTDLLHVGWAEAHDEACKLEHAMTDQLASTIEQSLSNPKTCPHGNPIPQPDGSLDASKSRALTVLSNGQRATVSHISHEDSRLLQYLSTLGLFPGVSLQVEEKAPFGGPLLVRVGSSSYALGTEVASRIFVFTNR